MKKLLLTILIASLVIQAPNALAQYLGAGWSDNFGTLNCSFTDEEGQCNNELFGSISFNTSLSGESIQGTGTLTETFDGDNEFQIQATIEQDNTLWGSIDSSFFGTFDMEGAVYIEDLNGANEGAGLETLDISDLAFAVNNGGLEEDTLNSLREHIIESTKKL